MQKKSKRIGKKEFTNFVLYYHVVKNISFDNLLVSKRLHFALKIHYLLITINFAKVFTEEILFL